MPRVTINGTPVVVNEGATILDALGTADVEVPTLCNDTRLAPTGGCRLCIVDIGGRDKPVTACNTVASDGAVIESHSEQVENLRRTLLSELARSYSPPDLERSENDFIRWVRHYGIEDQLGIRSEAGPNTLERDEERAEAVDDSHPYIRVDMGRCITCFRCVRICAEVQGQFVWEVVGRGESTRIVPDSGGSLADSSCVSCGACVDTCPSGALTDKSLAAVTAPIEWTRTTCEYCGTGCEYEAGVSAGRLVAARPVIDAPVNKGHLCVKGRYAHGYIYADDRITSPMVRDASGDWRSTSWPEALALVARRFAEIRERHGPGAIGVLGSSRGTNEENYLAQKFARVVLGTNNVDCCARVCHAPTAAAMSAMLGTGAATNSFDDIELARTFMVVGANPTENHPVIGARIRQQVLAGADLIVVDPRRIELVEIASIHLAPEPGTDIPLLNAMASVLVDEGLVDEEFIATRVDEYDEFAAFIATWTPEKAESVCGVEAAEIRRAAIAYGTGGPAMAFHGLGLTEHVQGTEQVMAVVNLALLTGNLGRRGSGVNPLRGQNNVQGSAHMGCEPKRLTGYVPLQEGRDRFERLWGAEIPADPGANFLEMLDRAAVGDLKALFCIGYDVYLSTSSATVTGDALRRLDFVVVQDLFMNETAREFGDVLLPAASALERDGTFMNSERRVQRIRQAIEPVGDSRPDWQIICDLANEMGHGRSFSYSSPAEIWDEVREAWLVGSGITYERLEAGGLQWPCADEVGDGTEVLHESTFAKSDRAALRRLDYVGSDEVPSERFPLLLTTGRTLYQFNAGTMTMRTENVILRPVDTVDISHGDARDRGIVDGDIVRLVSRNGEVEIEARIDERMKEGEIFATFHNPAIVLNAVTSRGRDRIASTPEYKRAAVEIELV